MYLSVIVPAYNAEKSLPLLLASLDNQTWPDFEVTVVDDGSSDNSALLVERSAYTLLQTSGNHGPAHARNLGAKASRGHIFVFTDADCNPEHDWLEQVAQQFSRREVAAIMGRLILENSNWLGNTISSLGFPAGGSLGFDKIWQVAPDGNTSSLSTCNCAVRKGAFQAAGGFDESFPFPGGEDTLLAKNLIDKGYSIKYCPDAVVRHAARSDLREFFRWQFKRGLSSYIFSRKITSPGSFIKLRLWSAGNVLKTGATHGNLAAVALFLTISYLAQLAGYIGARFDRKFYESIDH